MLPTIDSPGTAPARPFQVGTSRSDFCPVSTPRLRASLPTPVASLALAVSRPLSARSSPRVTSLPSWLETTVKALLALGALAYLVAVVEWSAIVKTLQQAEWMGVAGAVLLLPLNVGLDAWVWGVILSPVTGRLPLRRLVPAVMSGFALGFFTPARAGEYVGRTFHLDLAGSDTDGWTVSATIFTQRLVDMAVAVDVGTVALAVTMGLGFLPVSGPWIGVLSLGVAVGLMLTLFMLRPGWIDALLRRFFPSASRLHRRTRFLARLTPPQLARMFAGTITRYGVFALQFVLLGWAFAPDASVGLLVLAVGCTYFAAFLIPPVTLMDLGIREGAAVFFFGLMNLGEATGLNASVLIFLLNLVVPSAAGLPFLRGLHLSSTDDAPAQPSGPHPSAGAS